MAATRSDFACDEFVTPARRFMIEKNAGRSVNAVGLPIVARQVEAGNLADAIGGARKEAGLLGLRLFLRTAEHLARPREVEAAFGTGVLERRQHVMSSVHVDIHRGEFIVEGIAHEALRRQVIALVGSDREENPVKAGHVFERGGMQRRDPNHPMGRVFKRDPPDNAVNFVTAREQEFRKVRPVLACHSGNQCPLDGQRSFYPTIRNILYTAPSQCPESPTSMSLY